MSSVIYILLPKHWLYKRSLLSPCIQSVKRFERSKFNNVLCEICVGIILPPGPPSVSLFSTAATLASFSFWLSRKVLPRANVYLQIPNKPVSVKATEACKRLWGQSKDVLNCKSRIKKKVAGGADGKHVHWYSDRVGERWSGSSWGLDGVWINDEMFWKASAPIKRIKKTFQSHAFFREASIVNTCKSC